MVFPIIQLYESFGGKATPKSRAIVGAAASVALGLICAAILHVAFSGIQNFFGGFVLLAPLLMRSLDKLPGSRISKTIAVTAAAAVLSVAAYCAGAMILPGILAAAFSAAVLAKAAFVIQLATSAMFLWLFLPDTINRLRGRVCGGFSPWLSLAFCIGSVAFMAWAFPLGWVFAGAHRANFQQAFVVNAIYTVASYLSFRFARKHCRLPKP
jgi:hypothetical protein